MSAAMLVSMLHHVPDWEAALHEAQRAVHPGGVIVVMAFVREHLEVHLMEGYLPTALAHERLAADLSAGQRPQDGVAEVRAHLGDAVVMAWRRPGGPSLQA